MGRLAGNGITEAARGPLASPYAASKAKGEQSPARVPRSCADHHPATDVWSLGEGRTLLSVLCRAAALPVVPLPYGRRRPIPFATLATSLMRSLSRSVRRPAMTERSARHLRSYSRARSSRAGRGGGEAPPHHRRTEFRGQGGCSGSAVCLPVTGQDTHTGCHSPRNDDHVRVIVVGPFVEATGYTPPVDLHEAASRMARWYLGTRGSAESSSISCEIQWSS